MYFFSKRYGLAYYRQNITRDPVGKTTGYSFFVGFASAFEHIQYETGKFKDLVGLCMCLGLLWNSLLFIGPAMFA